MLIAVLLEGLDNKNLQRAHEAKNDEFYTRYEDIEEEIKYYKKHFRNKTVYCNCDNPFWSNFFFFFLENFNELGLKKIISSGLNSVKIEVNRINNLNRKEVLKLMREMKKALKGKSDTITTRNKNIDISLSTEDNGNKWSFTSQESLKCLAESDIVVTNPPFSLFRDFINTLFDFNKDFLIIGSNLASSLKDLFSKIRDGKVNIGMTSPSIFRSPEGEEKKVRTYWYSTLKSSEEKPFLELNATYTKKNYPEYRNFRAINVDSIKKIPKDYYGLQGVPINFLFKYNPKQFKLIGILARGLVSEKLKKAYKTEDKKIKLSQGILRVNGEDRNLFTRVLIKQIR